PPKVPRIKETKCCGVIEEAAVAAQEKRRNRTKPQPWIVRKLMIAVTLGIMGYAAYVYIRQLRGTGIALLVVFCILYLWMIWSYVVVCLTSPGYAKKYASEPPSSYIPKSERPVFPTEPVRDSWQWQSTVLSHTTSSGAPHDRDTEMGNRSSSQQPRRSSLSATTSRTHSSPLGMSQRNGLAGPSYEDLLKRDIGQQSPPQSQHERQDPNAGILDSITRPVPATLRDETRSSDASNGQYPLTSPDPTSSPTITSHQPDTNRTSAETHGPSFLTTKLKLKKSRPIQPGLTSSNTILSSRHEKALATERRLQALNVARKPSTAPVLDPVHRYCTLDGIVKPYRAHHCRACGTCVLKYDHHCPWIGQCVGARNHKYFLNFNQATVVLTGYILGTPSLNPQGIVLIALAALFLLFTSMLAISHTHLILNGQTTVESMQIRNIREREDHTLARGFKWWEVGAKRRKQREWDQEWGRIGKEGYIWWMGNKYEQWVDVMGKNWLGWILPIGRPGGDGLDYPVNPRFDSLGRWRRRSEWPEELR
ncbi:DHHC palmitoyltransferase-domain-containing protein, partial [Gymnopilus junonius]